ncbi:hypothetical protein ZHAS_00011501 [Anopheles sinensis]|uniref:Uncharacterized protein n=1 Tax=Anopheles sinensis TaxID=74873 RepID=A0A084W0L9_ANOSI|nr:hypothetical protein ZHAS_00011501 [Anopheles sinensis]
MELRQTMQRSLPAPTSPYQRQSSAAGCSNLPAGSELLLSHTLSTSGVRVRRKHLPNLPTICEKLRAIFNVQLQEIQSKEEPQYQQQFATFQVLQETIAGPGAAVGSTVGSIVIGNGDLLCQIQGER